MVSYAFRNRVTFLPIENDGKRQADTYITVIIELFTCLRILFCRFPHTHIQNKLMDGTETILIAVYWCLKFCEWKILFLSRKIICAILFLAQIKRRHFFYYVHRLWKLCVSINLTQCATVIIIHHTIWSDVRRTYLNPNLHLFFTHICTSFLRIKSDHIGEIHWQLHCDSQFVRLNINTKCLRDIC